MFILAFFAFLSGIVTILSPCILPVLPIVLSGSVGGKRKPLGVVAGFIGSFSVFTLLLSTLVQTFQIPPDTMRVAAVVIIVGFGLVMVLPGLQKQFEIMASRMVNNKNSKTGKTGFTGGLAIGAGLGLVWTPCVGPIMASVIGLAVSRQIDGGAVIIIVSYSIGTAIPMFAVMAGGRKLINRFPGLAGNTAKIQRVFGIIMILAGVSIGTGLDRQFQAKVLEVFPRYGSGLTGFENTKPVLDALNSRRDSGKEEVKLNDPPHNGRLQDYGPAPEILTQGEWFNSDPLSMADLKGKVVIIDFWTYSCINCIRTIPYLRSWYETYKDEGLVIIGVHSPEFAFERDPANVRQAIEDLGVSWPVVLDNSFDQWRAYNNRYWPAHYFIDAAGHIRYFHFGEGEYENSEKVIRALLKDAGSRIKEKAELPEKEGNDGRTAETYLGYGRAEGFLSENGGIKGNAAVYKLPETLKNGEWGLEGEWTLQRNYIESSGSGTLELGYEAKNVFLVIEPLSDNSRIQIYLDGLHDGTILPDRSRMYQILSLDVPGEHLLRLEVEGVVRLYAFTFG